MKTYKARTYVMTVSETETPAGTRGLLLGCTCATHKGTSGQAILETPTAVDDFPKGRIHGFVTMAHSPIGRASATVWKVGA
jgi:hypothetical protein